MTPLVQSVSIAVAFPRPRKARGTTALRTLEIVAAAANLSFCEGCLSQLIVTNEEANQLSRKLRSLLSWRIPARAAQSHRVLSEVAERPPPSTPTVICFYIF
ncbi:hypothetical protein Y032_0701g1649 [Ancylostoma ceylanicum]|uniref:Uncharacterized protein n=1 Tax=Ancylostoma ceylanicum TaxID=53326 RepID=A0A016WGF5_9BILA|nr:hypothetical protein Y032_0701g1649 [Ancylostoma ceylanicum]